MTAIDSSQGTPQTAAQWVEHGVQLTSEQRFEQARLCFKEALQLEPSHFEALHHLGIIAYKLKEYFLAIGFFQVAHHFSPDNAVLLQFGEYLQRVEAL